jgi:hypothetical protein
MSVNNRYKISQLKAFWLGSPDYTNFTGLRNEYSVNCFTPNQITTYTNSLTVNNLPDGCGYAAFNLNSTDGDSSQAT